MEGGSNRRETTAHVQGALEARGMLPAPSSTAFCSPPSYSPSSVLWTALRTVISALSLSSSFPSCIQLERQHTCLEAPRPAIKEAAYIRENHEKIVLHLQLRVHISTSNSTFSYSNDCIAYSIKTTCHALWSVQKNVRQRCC